VSPDVGNSTVCCVKACSELLGHKELDKIKPGPQYVLWHSILEEVCPTGTVICGFENVADLSKEPRNALDGLYIATINVRRATANHAMVLWKEESQLGSPNFELYDPGSNSVRRTVDITKS